MAAYGIVANLALVATSIFTGIAQGTQPLLSENFGQGNNKKILQLFKYAIYASLVVSVVLYFIVCYF